LIGERERRERERGGGGRGKGKRNWKGVRGTCGGGKVRARGRGNREKRERGLMKDRGGGGGITASGVHAASRLAASEKPTSDKHGPWHATPSNMGGYRGGYRRYLPEVSMLGCYASLCQFS